MFVNCSSWSGLWFLHHFCVVLETDTCYILSFAIIMLNTSLHNPNVKDKPSLQYFISMNRGINNGADLPAELLTVSCSSHTHIIYMC